MSEREGITNIESELIRISYEIITDGVLDEKEINKLLGVLTSNGVYAMWIYAIDKLGLNFCEDSSKFKEEKAIKLLKIIFDLCKYASLHLDFDEVIGKVVELTKDINRLSKEISKIKDKEEEKKFKEKKLLKEKDRIEILNETFISISKDLHKLLFVKQLLEKTLIYARYHAKALSKD